MPSVSINKVAESCAMRMKLACHPPSLLFDGQSPRDTLSMSLPVVYLSVCVLDARCQKIVPAPIRG